MRARPLHLLAVSLFLSLVGCGNDDKDPAQAACDLHFSCDCAPVNFPDVETCVADVNAQLAKVDDADKEVASANGLTFDQSCVDRERRVPDNLSCDYEPVETDECVACAKVHGNQPLGAGCTEKGAYSDCARELFCFQGVCLDPCQRLKSGDNCAGGTSLAQCDDGLFCDSNNTKKCQPTGGVGTPCPTGDGCNEDTYCGDKLTCQAPPKAGEACGPAGLCDEDLYCAADMTCKPVPGEGEPCELLCEDHYSCRSGTCVAGPAVGQPCPNDGSNCGPGARCAGDICVAEQSLFCELKPGEMMEAVE